MRRISFLWVEKALIVPGPGIVPEMSQSARHTCSVGSPGSDQSLNHWCGIPSLLQISATRCGVMDDRKQSCAAMSVELGVVLIGAGIAVGVSLAAAAWFERWKQRQS